MGKRLLSCGLLVLLFTSSVCRAGEEGKMNQADFCVSPTGADNNPGTASKPFATIAKARDTIFTNDEMATGVLRALHERGRRVPADVAVAGCDGLPIGLQTIPQLTTVALDYEQMGQTAVDRLFTRPDGNRPVFRVRLVPALVVRESTAQMNPQLT